MNPSSPAFVCTNKLTNAQRQALQVFSSSVQLNLYKQPTLIAELITRLVDPSFGERYANEIAKLGIEKAIYTSEQVRALGYVFNHSLYVKPSTYGYSTYESWYKWANRSWKSPYPVPLIIRFIDVRKLNTLTVIETLEQLDQVLEKPKNSVEEYERYISAYIRVDSFIEAPTSSAELASAETVNLPKEYELALLSPIVFMEAFFRGYFQALQPNDLITSLYTNLYRFCPDLVSKFPLRLGSGPWRFGSVRSGHTNLPYIREVAKRVSNKSSRTETVTDILSTRELLGEFKYVRVEFGGYEVVRTYPPSYHTRLELVREWFMCNDRTAENFISLLKTLTPFPSAFFFALDRFSKTDPNAQTILQSKQIAILDLLANFQLSHLSGSAIFKSTPKAVLFERLANYFQDDFNYTLADTEQLKNLPKIEDDPNCFENIYHNLSLIEGLTNELENCDWKTLYELQAYYYLAKSIKCLGACTKLKTLQLSESPTLSLTLVNWLGLGIAQGAPEILALIDPVLTLQLAGTFTSGEAVNELRQSIINAGVSGHRTLSMLPPN